MKVTCPACGYYGALEGFLQNEDYKKALAIACNLPGDLPRLTIQYLSLFRKPGADRALTGSKVLKICTEIGKLVLDKDIQWKNKRVIENKARYWVEAITKILEKAEQGRLERPLENNNLLRAIAYDIADKENEKALYRKEEKARHRTPQVKIDTKDRIDPEEQKAKAREILEKLRMNKGELGGVSRP